MDMTEKFPGHFKAEQIPTSGRTLTIKSVADEDVGQGKDMENKPVLYFEETQNTMVLNVTNCDTLCDLFGVESDDWLGQRVTLFQTTCQYGKDNDVPCVRVRAASDAQAASDALPESEAPADAESVPATDAEAAVITDAPAGEDIPF